MKFDKSKVCVAGLHEVKAGTIGYFSDDITSLRIYVEEKNSGMLGTFIKPEDETYITIDIQGFKEGYKFFYPNQEKQYRPYETMEEAEPLKDRWLKSKEGKSQFRVISLSSINQGLYVNSNPSKYVFENYTFEDGSPVGVEI